jgi:hypothetical protein
MTFVATFALVAAAALLSAPASAQAVIATCPTLNYGMRFHVATGTSPRSYLTNTTEAVVVENAFPRIIIQITDSDGNLQADAGYIRISVVQSAGNGALTFSQDTADVHRGEAHFTGMTVAVATAAVVPDPFYITFLATQTRGRSTRPYFVDGQTLTSGPVRYEKKAVDNPLFQLAFTAETSVLRRAGDRLAFVTGAALPPIRLAVLQHSFAVYDNIQTGSNYSVSCHFATAAPGATLANNLVPVLSGIATFRELAITSGAATLPPLVFVLHNPGGVLLNVSSGPVVASTLFDYDHIAFESEDKSFIFTEGQELTAVGGIALPPIQITLRDTLYGSSPPTTGLIVTAHCHRCSTELSGNVVGVVGGVATFSALTFEGMANDPEHVAPKPYYISFTAGNQGSLRLAGETLFSGFVMVSSGVLPGVRSIRFLQKTYESFFTARDQPAQVALGVELDPPIKLMVMDSANQLDTTALIMVESLALGKQTNFGSGGYAEFAGVTIQKTKAGENKRLDFKAAGMTLWTGTIDAATTITDFGMRFQPHGASLFALPSVASFATTNVVLPRVAVELITSAKRLDTQSNDIGITATAAGAILSGSFVRVSRGVAVFDSLMFVSEMPGTYHVTFTAGTEVPSVVGGKSLVTGGIDVVASATPSFAPRFRKLDSYIAYEGHVMPITKDRVIPDIIIELVPSTHAVDAGANVTASNLVINVLQPSNGALSSATTVQTTFDFVANVATVTGLAVSCDSCDPILTFCVGAKDTESGNVDTSVGKCVSSGPLRLSPNVIRIGALQILSQQLVPTLPVTVASQFAPISITAKQTMKIAVGMLNSTGGFNPDSPITFTDGVNIQATSSLGLGSSSVEMNKLTGAGLYAGVAYFDQLVFSSDIAVGVFPSITFTATSTGATPLPKVDPIATQFITTLQLGQASGQTVGDVVAEVLHDVATFSFPKWRAALSRRLNIEEKRIVNLRVFAGTSADDTGLKEDDESTAFRAASWKGTRIDLRFLPPLPTSRDKKAPEDIAKFFVSLDPSCAIGELFLRKTYLKAKEATCDWYIFDGQMNAVRSCIQARGKKGYCSCHVPLINTMGVRCLGLPRLTNLCLNVLINSESANCKTADITAVCNRLAFPDAPRIQLLISALVLLLFMPPIAYMYWKGFFHKLHRPTSGKNTITRMEAHTYDDNML